VTRTTARGFHRQQKPSGKQTREELLDALDKVIQTTSWRRISVRMLTEELAQKHNSVFYYHFASIEQAVRELIAERYKTIKDVPKHLRLIRDLIDLEAEEGIEEK
jgi:AcrR family transcriptional regulator